MIWLFAGVGLLIAFLLFREWFVGTDPEKLAKATRLAAAGFLGLFALFFAVTGRFAIAGPAAAGAFYLWRVATRKRADGHTENGGRSGPGAAGEGPMTIDEARHILGVGPDASPDEIAKAHRRLMKKLHPDQGGSDYLASKINQAKDMLLER